MSFVRDLYRPISRDLARALIQGEGGSNIITSIFADGTDGFYFDFSRTNRLFQSSSGLLTAADDPAENIGLAYESSKWAGRSFDAQLSSSTAVLNEAFSYASKAATQSAGWSSSGVEDPANVVWTIDTNRLSITRGAGTTAGGPLLAVAGLTVGRSYVIELDVISGTAALSLSGNLGSIGSITAGTRRIAFVAAATSGNLVLWCNSSSTAVIDNLSIRPVVGNHGTQSTTAAQPKYQTGGLARFDGTDDCLVTTLQPTTAGSFVVKFNKAVGNSAQVVMGCRSVTTDDAFILLATDGRILGNVGSGVNLTGGANYSGQTVVAAITWDGSTVNLYGNGALLATQAQSGVVGANNTILGSAMASSLFASVDIYHALAIKKALSAAQIAAITNLWGTS